MEIETTSQVAGYSGGKSSLSYFQGLNVGVKTADLCAG